MPDNAVPSVGLEAVEAVRSAVKKNPKFKEVFKIFAGRDRGRQVTTFRRLMRVLDEEKVKGWSREDVQELFDMLQDAKVGWIDYEGDTPTFNWYVHLQDFACLVLEKPRPDRKRKDGSVIPNAKDKVRTVTPPRTVIPKMSAVGAVPVGSGMSYLPRTESGRRLMSLVREFFRDLDITKLSPGALKKMQEILLLLSEQS